MEEKLKYAELLHYAVYVLGVNPPEWFAEHRREMNIWYSVFLCLVDDKNEKSASDLFESWMQRSGFLADAKREMSPKNQKSLGLDGLKCEYV